MEHFAMKNEKLIYLLMAASVFVYF